MRSLLIINQKAPIDNEIINMETISIAADNYTTKDTRKIIKRALELQQADIGTENINIEELEEIGTEIGIKSSYIQNAARELAISRDSRRIFGTSVNVTESFSLETFVDNEKLKQLMDFLPDLTEKKGFGSIIRGRLSWSSDQESDSGSLDPINIRVRRRKNRTEIKLSKDLSKLAVALYVGLGVGGGVGIGVGIGVGVGVPLGLTLFSILFPIGSICTAGILAGHMYKRIVKQKRLQLAELADDIKKEITAH